MEARRSVAGLYIAVAVYCLLNLLFFLNIRPYLPQAPELLSNGDFADGLSAWRIEGEEPSRVAVSEGVLSLDHPVASSSTLAQCWPAQALPQPLILSAEARSDGVLHGSKRWHEARIDLVGYDGQGRGIYRTHTRLLGLHGSHPWRSASALFRLPAEAQRACVEISLYSAPGRFQVRHLSLLPGAESLLHHVGSWLLLAGWILIALWLAIPLARHLWGARLGRWLLLVALLLLAGVLMPYEIRLQMENWILRLLGTIGVSLPVEESLGSENAWAPWPAHWDLSKYSHLAGFTLLAALLAADRQSGRTRVLAALLLLAVSTEILQFFVPLRTPRLSDVVVDSLGILLGTGLGLLRVWLSRRRPGGSG